MVACKTHSSAAMCAVVPMCVRPEPRQGTMRLMGMSTLAKEAPRRMAVRVLAALIVASLVALAALAWWADQQGYVSITGESCTDEGHHPTPTYEELRTKYGKSPYCARLYLDETWF